MFDQSMLCFDGIAILGSCMLVEDVCDGFVVLLIVVSAFLGIGGVG